MVIKYSLVKQKDIDIKFQVHTQTTEMVNKTVENFFHRKNKKIVGKKHKIEFRK